MGKGVEDGCHRQGSRSNVERKNMAGRAALVLRPSDCRIYVREGEFFCKNDFGMAVLTWEHRIMLCQSVAQINYYNQATARTNYTSRECHEGSDVPQPIQEAKML